MNTHTLVFLVAVAGVPSLASAAEVLVIPPGQEKLIGQMAGLGTTLAGCSLEDAQARRSHLALRYGCPSGKALVEMHAKGSLDGALATTEKFVITAPSGEAPQELIDALATQVRAGEGRWHWMRVRSETEPIGRLEPTAPIAKLPTNTEDLDPALFAMYEKAVEEHKRGHFKLAVDGFAAVARLNPRFSGALGMVVASLAPSSPDAARVAELSQIADAAPNDALAQFMAGVAAHYSAHYTAETREQKLELYRMTIRYLEKARATYDFEPRIYIYLAVSHYRLGEQAEAEALIERAVELDANDPDAYYCRAEIWHRKDPENAIADLDRYLEMSAMLAEPGSKVAEAKIERVKSLREHLQKVASGEGQPAEIFDPLEGAAAPITAEPAQGAVATALGSSPLFAWIIVFVALTGLAVTVKTLRRRRDQQQGPPQS